MRRPGETPDLRKPDAFTLGEYQALASFRHALREFLRFSEAAAEAVGLTPRQYQALLAIKGMPTSQAPTIGDLAAQLQVRHHSAVGLVDRLVQQGLVVRNVSREDRRRVQLSLTPRGERLLLRLASAHRVELQQLGPRLKTVLAQLGARARDRAGPRRGR